MDQKRLKNTFSSKRKSIFLTLGAIILLLCLTLVSALTLRNTNFANLSMAGNSSSIDFLNRQIENKIQKYRIGELSDRTKINKEIRDYAQTRENILLKELKEDPQLFLTHAVLSDEIVVLPKNTQGLFEKKVKDLNNLKVVSSDSSQSSEQKKSYQGTIGENIDQLIYNLIFINEPKANISTIFKVSGMVLENNLLVTGFATEAAIPALLIKP